MIMFPELVGELGSPEDMLKGIDIKIIVDGKVYSPHKLNHFSHITKTYLMTNIQSRWNCKC